MPHVSAITSLERLAGNTVRVHRDAKGGNTELVEVELPALFTAQQGLNEPRYPSLPGIMKAKRKTVQVVEASELAAPSAEPQTERLALQTPPPRKAGKRIAGEPAEQARQLIRLLREEARCI